MQPLINFQPTVTIERIIPGGRGLAFHQGRAVFVPLAVPGDSILLQRVEDRRHYLEALSIEVLKPSPHRIVPPCRYFGNCGGCDFQHMSYERQLSSKAEILADVLRRIGKIQFPVSEIKVTPSPPWAYRNRLQLKISEVDFSWGFFQNASHQVCPVEDCLIASTDLWGFLMALRRILQDSDHLRSCLTGVEVIQGDRNQYLVDLETGDPQVDSVLLGQELRSRILECMQAEVSLFLSSSPGKSVKILGPGYIWKTVGGLEYRVSHGSFFQINDPMLETLRNCAVTGVSGKHALDLYCGVGFFSLALARNFDELWVVERNGSAVDDFHANVNQNQIRNCRLFPQDLKTFIQQQSSSLPALDLVLIDPPRMGLDKESVNQVAAIGAGDVVYVSCDPSTLARDLRIFCNHQYQIVSLDLLDLFPQTHHLETIAKLKKVEKMR